MLKIDGLAIDNQRRITIPVSISRNFILGNFVYLTENWENGCLCIYREHKRSLFVVEVSVRMDPKNVIRINVPEEFLDSNTFYCGKTFSMVLFDDRIELWPWKDKES